MSKPDNSIQETPAQKAQYEIATAQLKDWRQRYLPVLKTYAAQTERAGLADSQERRHATAMTGTDTSAKFGQANDAALAQSTASGTLGSSRQKLGLTGMGDDQATSTGFGSVAADQAVDDSTVQGLKAVTSIARGEKADTMDAIGRNAAISGAQAANDAEMSLQNRIGNASLAGKIIGGAGGLWMGQAKTPGSLPDPRAGVRGQLGYGG